MIFQLCPQHAGAACIATRSSLWHETLQEKKSFPVLCLLFACLAILYIPHTQAAGLERSVDRIMANHLLPNGPGASVLIMKNNQVILKKSYGLADLQSKRPVNINTRFDLASVSKPMTSLVILRLIEKNHFRLDDPVQSVIKDFRVPRIGRQVRVRDLLQHTSGLADYTVSYPGSDQQFSKINTESHLKWLNTTRSKSAPGLRFQYNNSNYTLLALIAERVTGHPFARVVQEEIFQPAGMGGSFVYDGQAALPTNVAVGYKVQNGYARPSLLLTDITGDGNVYTSVSDLAKFITSLNKGLIVRPSSLKQAWTNGRLDNGIGIRASGLGYGLGWEIDGRQRSHSGEWYGSSAYMEIDSTWKTAVIVLSNDENFEVFSVARSIRYLIP